MPQPNSVWCSDHSICYIGAAVLTCGCITVRWHIHLPSGSPLPAAWYPLWILSLFKEAGRLVFPCCIAAISTAFDLKNASPLFRSLHWWWLTLQHTLQKSPLMHPRGRESGGERERERKERDIFVYVPVTHNACSCVLIYLLHLHKYLNSSAFLAVPCRVEMQLVFLHR